MEKSKYRFYPILFLAFLRVAVGVAIGLAIPLYYLDIGIDPEIIGIITSGTAMAYLVSPIIFRNMYKKIGMKYTLLISTAGFLIIQIILQISLVPLLVFTLLIFDGIVLGMFWPVLMTAISIISDSKKSEKHHSENNNVMKHYSLSWNFGGIFSFLLGTIVLIFIEDHLIMFRFALIFAIIGFTFALLFQEPNKVLDKDIIVPIDERVKDIPNRENISFPLILPLSMIAVYGFLIAGLGLAYPIKSEILNFALFTNYLFYFFRMTTQTISISKSMDFSIKFLKKIIPFSNLIIIITLFLMALNQNIIIFGISFCIFGIFHSFYYTFSFKLIIFRNIAKNTSKYSVYFETLVGIGFFFGPIITGFIAGFNENIAFHFLASLSLLNLIFFLILAKKVKDK
ncbi:MAG: MFS transporter [Candidatus Heimdallarchaeota archaeon]